MPTRITPAEMEYIRKNCLSKTDEQIAVHLKRGTISITKARKRLGIQKGSRGSIKDIKATKQNGVGYHLTENQRKEFFKTQLVNSLYYRTLKEQFTQDEVDFYLEEWAALSIQFDDIANTEKRQIDELIKAEILGNRILRNVKIAEMEIELLVKEVEEFRKTHDVENSEEAQERDNTLMNMIRAIHNQSQVMSQDYQKNVESKNKILGELNARRRDRIDQIKKGGTTFIGLVEALRDQKVREVQGRHMELVRLAKEKKRNEWHKPMVFADGTKDCILMDEDSQIVEKELVLREESVNCKMILKYKDLKDKNVLIIDDDQFRCQFFSEVLKGNKLIFASNVTKAKKAILEDETLEYDFICLDYDLGLEEKGIEFVNFILNKNICKKTDILIHSMNKEEAGKMFTILTLERNTELYPFDDIYQEFKRLNMTLKLEKEEKKD